MTERRWVHHAMGTTVTLAGTLDDAQAQRIFASIDEDEAQFSRFLPHSELSRFARGEVERDHASAELRQLLIRCEELRADTDGDFEHEPRRIAPADGAEDVSLPVLDVNAFAKGWIVDRAAIVGIACGGRRFSINAGGDITIVGHRHQAQRVGIVDPGDPHNIIAVLEVMTGAVATSGRYERGDHLRTDAHVVQSATVVGPSLGTADALATAALVSGDVLASWWRRFPDYSILTIDDNGDVRATDGMFHYLSVPRTPSPVPQVPQNVW